jgi:putative alpha-1,2-mannosidase
LGSGKYTVTSPLFTKAIVNRDNGDKLNILANNNNVNNKYISSLKIDNKFHTDVYISQDEILKGNHTLEFNMSNIPTS